MMLMSRVCFAIYLIFLANLKLVCGEDVLRPDGRLGFSYFDNKTIFGFEAGLNFNSLSQNISHRPEFFDSPQNALSVGSGISPFFSAFLLIPIQSNLGIELKFGYDSKSVENSKKSVMDYDFINDRLVVSNNLRTKIKTNKFDVEGSLTIKSDVEYKYNLNYSFFTFSPSLYYEIIPRLFINIGPNLHIPLSNKTDKTYTIYNEFFVGGKKSQTVSEDIKLSTRIGVEISVSYDFPLSPAVSIAPILRYQLMLTKTSGNYTVLDPPLGIDADIHSSMLVEPKNLNSLQAGLRLKIGI